MNYDCELIRDIAPLYRDGALSEGGKKIVEEHLAQCAVCREYYADEDNRTLPALPHDSETQEIALLSKKLKKRRLYQVGMFAAVLALLFFSAAALVWLSRRRRNCGACYPLPSAGSCRAGLHFICGLVPVCT